MARGRHYAKLSLSNAARLSFSDLCILLFMFLSLCRLCVCVFLCSHWSLVDVPLIFFCPADHVPDWQPRVLLGMVEARSVNVKKTTTTTVLSNVNPARGHKEVVLRRRSTGRIVMTTRYPNPHRDPNRDKIFARSNQPITSETYRRQDVASLGRSSLSTAWRGALPEFQNMKYKLQRRPQSHTYQNQSIILPAPAAFPAGVDPNRGNEETVRSPGETVRSPGVL